MGDLGYPTDAVSLIGNIYTIPSTTFIGPYFGKTQPIPIARRIMQGDTLSPYLLVFLEPLLNWLKQDNYGYHFNISDTQTSSTIYANNLTIISPHLPIYNPKSTN